MTPTDPHRSRTAGVRQRKVLERRVWGALTSIPDPATPNVDLMNMGMIYQVEIGERGEVRIDLAFSSPGHPGNLDLPKRVADTIRELDGITDCRVRVVSDPPWTLDRVSDYARVNLSVVGDGT
jgi:metal-sulfur cluster biosynthetic enzyme